MSSTTERMTATAVTSLVSLAGLGAALLLVPVEVPHRAPLAISVVLVAAVALAWNRWRHGLVPGPSRTFVVALVLVVMVLGVLGPARRSKDMWLYVMFGRTVSHHHENPFTTPPSAFPDDPYYSKVNPRWRNTRSVYGPLVVGYAAAITAVGGDHEGIVRLLAKVVPAAGLGGALWLLLKERSRPIGIAVAFLSPAVALYQTGGGHADGLVALGVVGGLVAAAHRRPVAAAALVAAGALVKANGLFIALPIVAWLWSRPDDGGRRDAMRFAVTVTALTAVPYAFIASGWLRSLSQQTAVTGWTSFWRPIALATTGHAVAPTVTRIAGTFVLGLIAATSWRGRRDATPYATGAIAMLVSATIGSYVLAWYLAWVLPVVALTRRWRILTVGTALALTMSIGDDGLTQAAMAACAVASVALVVWPGVDDPSDDRVAGVSPSSGPLADSAGDPAEVAARSLVGGTGHHRIGT